MSSWVPKTSCLQSALFLLFSLDFPTKSAVSSHLSTQVHHLNLHKLCKQFRHGRRSITNKQRTKKRKQSKIKKDDEFDKIEQCRDQQSQIASYLKISIGLL